MALMTMTFESKFLRSAQPFSMILPEMPREETPSDFYSRTSGLKVVWLLHGTFGDHTDWVRKTNVERYAARKGVAVVMPSALNSNYSNWSGAMLGYDAYDYLLQELMPLVHNWFPVSSRREDNFIAGLSMGGRGTVKIAASNPDRFAAAAILSAAPEEYSLLTEPYLESDDMMAQRVRGMVANAGGLEAFVNSPENAWRVISETVSSGRLPRMLFATGTEDHYIVEKLQTFRRHADEIGLDAEFFHGDGFGHEWDFWDLAIQKAFEFFGLPDVESNPF